MKPIMNYELAMAAGMDAANRRMRAAGRSKWNRGDYNEVGKTFDRLMPDFVWQCDPHENGWHMEPNGSWYGSIDQRPAR